MPLIIPQGKQDTTQDNKFNPITANDVMLEITELKLAKTQQNTLEVTLRVLDGQHKNRFVFDRVTFDANSPMSWKYRQLRKCAGVPYQENEPTSIDIEALLLHKAVKADLGVRKGKNKDGEEQEYQDIKYKVIVVKPVTPAPTPVATPKPAPTPVETKPAPAVVDNTPVSFEESNSVHIDDEIEWD